MLRLIAPLAAALASIYAGGPQKANPNGLSGSDRASIRAEYERHRRAAFPVAGGHRARNYGQQWVTRFDGRGFDVTPDAAGWRWGLELQSYGFPGQELSVKHARASADVEKLAYQWDSTIKEWFVNGSSGLEHGFTLASRPGSNSAPGALTLHLAVRGTLTPHVSSDGLWVSFMDHGVAALNYAGLKVTDAEGRKLAARFTQESRGLRLDVEERGARYPITIDPVAQQAYLKPNAVGNTQAGDLFGFAVSVSGDTVVVGARDEDSSSLGVNSTPNELAAGSSGAAYVFVRSAGQWSQQAYLKPAAVGPGGQAGDHFGWSVAISGDTVVVGAPDEDSNTFGVNSTPVEGATNSGAAYVFIRIGGVWSQQAYLKQGAAGMPRASDEFGYSVAISGDTLVVGSYDDPSSTTGINSAPNTLASGAGGAYVFARFGGVWSQQAYLKPAAVGTTQANDHFGNSVALSGDTLVVGAPGEDSSTLGVNTTPNELASLSGAAYVFTRSAGVWSQHSYLKPAAVGTTQLNDSFGWSVAVSGDTLVVGAPNEDSSSLGVNSTPNEGATEAGAAYTFIVTVPSPISPGLVFVPVSPCRVVDTRLSFGTFGGPSIAALTQRDFPIPLGSCGIPSNAAAFSLNVTVVPATTLGYLTIFPTGAAQPLVSTLNSVDGRIKANAAIVPAGTNGSVSVFVTNQTDVILDINGYFVPVGAPNGLSFYPVNPCRVVDTRLANGPLGGPTMQGQATRDFPVPSSACGIPSSARAYSLNMTVVPTTNLGYLTTWPSGGAQPFVSTLNDLTGTIVANAAIVPAGASGSISVFVTNVTTLIIDINGYFAPPGNPGALSFYTVNPCRVVDTRLANGPLGGPVLSAGSSRDFPIPNASCGLPGAAQAYSMNATVVPPGFLGFLSLWPSGQSQPFVSTLNATDGAITANAAIVPAGVNGAVSAYVSHQSQLILDVNGYFAP